MGDEVRRLIPKAKEWTRPSGTPVGLGMSDQQDAFVKGIAAEFPDVPHRYCQNHFLRDVAEEVLAADSHAKVKMRSKVRGLRAIEREVLSQQRAEAAAAAPPLVVPVDGPVPDVPAEALVAATTAAVPSGDVGAVVLDYCTA